jgi:outer membrane protein assembly factor BamE (lipoprotein component of BamABCDE complex)
MFKKMTYIGFLLLVVTFNSYANDSDRIDQLEKEVQGLKLRLSKIEALPSNPSNAQEPVTSGDGWKSVKNWRKLTTDMSARDVQKILGEPERLDGGAVARWYYQNGGIVTFINGKAFKWEEPQR